MVRVLAVDDEEPFRRLLKRELTRKGIYLETAANGAEALERLSQEPYDVMLLDLVMPGIDGLEVLKKIKENPSAPTVIVITGNASVGTAVEAMRWGAFDYLSKPYKLDELKIVIDRAYDFNLLTRKNEILQQELDRNADTSNEIVGNSPAIRQVLSLVRKVAPTDSTVLITGESGTGKELVAAAIRKLSKRSGAPFTALNCATLAGQLIESELFGHERGAFTDAYKTKYGIVEAADKGTLFLDEVGELPLELQVKLLRFLDSGEFRRVGGTHSLKADVRLIAATNRDLGLMIQAGTFREDLYYRLKVFNITVPPLRGRTEDIPELAAFFLQRSARKLSKNVKTFSASAMAMLLAYHWPGNVRELEHEVERAVILAESDIIEAHDLSLAPSGQSAKPSHAQPEPYVPLEEVEREYIRRVLDETGGNQSMASRILGINRKTLYLKMKRYGLADGKT